MKKRIAILLALLLAFTLTTNAFAQDYYFSLDKEVVNVYWNSDGTMALDYLLTFTTQPSGHTIEFVDVGMPNGSFDFGSIKADINGRPLSISKDFQGTGGDGFAVEMGPYAIPPGETGTVHVYVGRVSNVLYNDDKDSNYASADFSPLYFQSSVITGTTDITVTYHLPPGIQTDAPRWHSAPSGFPSEPQTGLDQDGRITYTWRNENANGHTQYLFGASFPKSAVPNAVIVQPPAFEFPQINFSGICNLLFFCCIGLLFFGTPIINAVTASRRKLKYLPPKISIEGHGIKRGLTAVEAAILMEQPLDKVMTMILFGVIKKNAAEVVTRDPLALNVTSPLPDGLRDYELNFLKAFKENDPRARRKLLQDMSVKLVKSLSEKMKGFSRRETLEYYKNIMEKAWQQVEAADTPEVKSKMLDETLEWTMLDRNYDDRTRRVFAGPVFVPIWWGRYDPTWRGGSVSAPMAAPTMGRGSSALPGADFAASVVGGVQTFSSKVIGNVGDFTSRVTNVTNPLPKPTSSGYRGGRSGGGCACACACAGCACACAGGGR